jgi:hypothetical protein
LTTATRSQLLELKIDRSDSSAAVWRHSGTGSIKFLRLGLVVDITNLRVCYL